MKKHPFFQCDFQSHFSALTDEQAGKIIKAIFAYQKNLTKTYFNLNLTPNSHENSPEFTQNSADFTPNLPLFEDDFLQAYWLLTLEKVRKTSLFDKRSFTSASNGAKGGRPKKNLNNLNRSSKFYIINRLKAIQEELDCRKSKKTIIQKFV